MGKEAGEADHKDGIGTLGARIADICPTIAENQHTSRWTADLGG